MIQRHLPQPRSGDAVSHLLNRISHQQVNRVVLGPGIHSAKTRAEFANPNPRDATKRQFRHIIGQPVEIFIAGDWLVLTLRTTLGLAGQDLPGPPRSILRGIDIHTLEQRSSARKRRPKSITADCSGEGPFSSRHRSHWCHEARCQRVSTGLLESEVAPCPSLRRQDRQRFRHIPRLKHRLLSASQCRLLGQRQRCPLQPPLRQNHRQLLDCVRSTPRQGTTASSIELDELDCVTHQMHRRVTNPDRPAGQHPPTRHVDARNLLRAGLNGLIAYGRPTNTTAIDGITQRGPHPLRSSRARVSINQLLDRPRPREKPGRNRVVFPLLGSAQACVTHKERRISVLRWIPKARGKPPQRRRHRQDQRTHHIPRAQHRIRCRHQRTR